MKRIAILVLTLLALFNTVSAQISTQLYAASPLLTQLGDDITLVRSITIGTIRPGTSDFGVSIYRVTVATANARATVRSSGRVVNCYIPTTASATNGSDHHLSVINTTTGYVCELFGAARVSGSATDWTADGAYLYPISGSGISPQFGCDSSGRNCVVYRTTASGLSVINFAITLEDVADIQAGHLSHGLSFALPSSLVNGDENSGYVAPATASETKGTAGSTGIPMGAIFTLPRGYEVPNGLNIVSTAVLQSLRDYGFIVADVASPPNYGGLAVGAFRIEPAAQQALGFAADQPNAGCTSGSTLLRCVVQAEVYNEIQRVGLWRVSNTTVITPTAAPSRTPTRTPTVSITATRTPTRTPTVTYTPSPTSLTLTPTLAGTECGLVLSPVVTLSCR